MNNNNLNEKSADDLLDDLFSDESETRSPAARKSRGTGETTVIDSDRDESTYGKKNTAVLSALEWLEMFVSCFAVVLIIVTFIARHSPVIGSSMANTLHEKDVVIVQQLFYEPEQGDIIVAQSVPHGYDEPIVKRVIATGGQTIDIDFDTWTVTVDGTVLDESYVLRPENVPMIHKDVTFPLTVPEGYLFVMGDNRNGSLDSRDSGIGLIDERMVVGHVVFRVLPFDALGALS